VPILYVLIPVIPAKFWRYLPVLESPEYRKTGFGIAGIGNTTSWLLGTWPLGHSSSSALGLLGSLALGLLGTRAPGLSGTLALVISGFMGSWGHARCLYNKVRYFRGFYVLVVGGACVYNFRYQVSLL
jgi:hypothetical protein